MTCPESGRDMETKQGGRLPRHRQRLPGPGPLLLAGTAFASLLPAPAHQGANRSTPGSIGTLGQNVP